MEGSQYKTWNNITKKIIPHIRKTCRLLRRSHWIHENRIPTFLLKASVQERLIPKKPEMMAFSSS
jgi:hypothetical protein